MRNIENYNNRGSELMQTLVQKSWDSTDFKANLIQNPVATIERVTGRAANLPVNKVIVVEDQTDSSVIYLNIPSQPKIDELELTEEQLETVAGGATPGLALLVVIGFGGTWALDKIF